MRFHPFLHLFALGSGLFIGTLVLIVMALWIFALVDVCRRQFKTPETKILWIVVILVAHVVGSIIYFAVGRDQGVLPGQGPAA